MREPSHGPSVASAVATDKGETVSISVDYDHPLLKLKRALPWEAIFAVLIRRWRAAGKNVDGGPGLGWDVSLYGPLVVLMVVKNFSSRQMEAYVSENVVARVFIARQHDPTPQIRDHANIARAYAALGKEGVEEINALILHAAKRFGFADPRRLSADTTAQELPIGYPNQEEKQQVLRRIITETEQLMAHTHHVVTILGQPLERVKSAAINTLKTMQEVATRLIPQIIQWMTTGVVAKGKILHAGLPQARAIVRQKPGKKVEFGLRYLLNRIGGGYLFGTVVLASPDESKMPLLSLTCYREIFGQQAVPELLVYDRGGYATSTLKKLAKEGIKQVGIQPKGKGAWLVAEEVRETIRSERGKTEGSIGTLKTAKYGFNKPRERHWQTLQMAGPRSILSFNLNKLMRDLMKAQQALPVTH